MKFTIIQKIKSSFHNTSKVILSTSLIIVYPQLLVLESPQSQWILWNVGQGQWLTYVKDNKCYHFDFGGEYNPMINVKKYCLWRMNILILSHPDSDHFNFINSIKATMKQLCLWGPSWKNLNMKKIKVTQIPNCKEQLEPNKKNLYFFNPHFKSLTDDNLNSQIVTIEDWLITGDAPKRTEKKWLQVGINENSVKKLVLGHHGSKTSTSEELIHSLIHLNQCLVSARKKRYGHPHKVVLDRIHEHCPLLNTEDWNHIHILVQK